MYTSQQVHFQANSQTEWRMVSPASHSTISMWSGIAKTELPLLQLFCLHFRALGRGGPSLQQDHNPPRKLDMWSGIAKTAPEDARSPSCPILQTKIKELAAMDRPSSLRTTLECSLLLWISTVANLSVGFLDLILYRVGAFSLILWP